MAKKLKKWRIFNNLKCNKFPYLNLFYKIYFHKMNVSYHTKQLNEHKNFTESNK